MPQRADHRLDPTSRGFYGAEDGAASVTVTRGSSPEAGAEKAATTTDPTVVTAASKKRGPKSRVERETDPEVKAEIDAFFAHMVRPPGD